MQQGRQAHTARSEPGVTVTSTRKGRKYFSSSMEEPILRSTRQQHVSSSSFSFLGCCSLGLVTETDSAGADTFLHTEYIRMHSEIMPEYLHVSYLHLSVVKQLQ